MGVSAAGVKGREDRRPARLGAASVVARIRWLGVALAVVQAFLTSPPPISRAGVVGAAALLAGYNLWLLVCLRTGQGAGARAAVPASLAVDFLACTALVMLFANDRYGTNYVIYALVGIEAAVLYGRRGALGFIAAYALGTAALYIQREVFFGFPPEAGSVLFRFAVVALIALLGGGISATSERSAAEARQQARRAEALSVVAGRISQTLKREYVLDTVMDSLERLFPERWHGLLLYDDTGLLTLQYARGAGSPLKLAYPRSPLPDGTSRRVLEEVAGSDLVLPEELRGFRSAALLALRSPERAFGVLMSLDPAPQGFAGDEVGFLEALASQASTGLENAQLYEEVELLSLTDVTTALFNRRALDSRLLEEFFRAQRYDLPLSLLMIDVDHFKQYNDVHGHLAGDRVLKRLGEVLAREALRRVDVAFRYGGEEFAVLMPMTPTKQAMQVAERIRAAVAGSELPGRGTQPNGHVSVSVGVASYPNHAIDANELLEAADRALYSAKLGGRDRVAVYEPEGARDKAL
jgi:diguanylate cyclase (GGDEF)-like protein